MNLNETRDRRTRKLLKLREPIVELCGSCNSVGKMVKDSDGKETIMDVCDIYLDPDKKWRMGDCPRCSVFHEPIVDLCTNCDHVEKIIVEKEKMDICDSFIYPDHQWEDGECIKSSHTKTRSGKINPLKASRRSVRSR